MALPFFHMRSSSFWHLLPFPGKEALFEVTRQVDTLSQLQKLTLGAKLDDELFKLLQMEEPRNAFTNSFDPDILCPGISPASASTRFRQPSDLSVQPGVD